MSVAVSFRTPDGVTLAGRLFGEGRTALALAHMGRGYDNQADWFRLAAALASDGVTVLTFDRRGVCPGDVAGCSKGDPGYELAWKDVIGAVSFLEDRGFGRIFIGGASIGAMASLRAAETLRERVAGEIWVAGLRDASGYRFLREDVAAVTVPKLFMSATDDPYGAASDARTLYRWAKQPKSLVLLKSDRHGTDMLAPVSGEEAVSQELIGAVASFLREWST